MANRQKQMQKRKLKLQKTKQKQRDNESYFCESLKYQKPRYVPIKQYFDLLVCSFVRARNNLEPFAFSDEWLGYLYKNLIKKLRAYGLSGASKGNETLLFTVQNDVTQECIKLILTCLAKEALNTDYTLNEYISVIKTLNYIRKKNSNPDDRSADYLDFILGHTQADDALIEKLTSGAGITIPPMNLMLMQQSNHCGWHPHHHHH